LRLVRVLELYAQSQE